LSYRRPAILAFNSPMAPSTGVYSVTISGYDFAGQDRSAGVRVFLTSALASVWLSDSSLRIKVARGAGQISSALVSFQGESSLSTTIFSYMSAVVSFSSRTNQPSTGSSVVIFEGSYFGSAAYSLILRVGTSSGLSLLWNSDSSVTLKCPSGVGSAITLTVSVEKITSLFSDTMSYDVNTISRVRPFGLPTSGSFVVSVFGKGSGSFGRSIKIFMGSSNCVLSMWTSSSQISCKASSGVSSRHGVVVSLMHHVAGSQTHVISYNRIPISSPNLVISNSPCTGAVVLVQQDHLLEIKDILFPSH